ncbi:hypothetical protein BU17DRAFT_101497 [Hysterangium stoloniferum]|nr:hypothetical protein BU17DRAFT_101497 [Hysterangium stoloniferum]
MDSSNKGFEHALVPWAHQHFSGGRDTGGVREEMAMKSKQDIGSSSVQEQA